MKKKYYDEKLYLTGDKEAVKSILELKQGYALLYAIEELRYSEGLKKYNQFIRILRDFLKTLDLESSLEYSIAISYLIKHGYLTFDKEFKDKETKEEIHTRYGTSILKGYGVCRNYADVNKDLLTLLDYYVKNIYCYCPTFSLPPSARLKQSNHVVNLIEYNGIKYGIDLFNNCNLYHFETPFILERITSKGSFKMRYKPYFEVISGDSEFEDIFNQIKDFRKQCKKEIITASEYEDEIRPFVYTYLDNKKWYLDDFHEETKDLKKEIVLKLTV